MYKANDKVIAVNSISEPFDIGTLSGGIEYCKANDILIIRSIVCWPTATKKIFTVSHENIIDPDKFFRVSITEIKPYHA